ncbi:LacI family DNA-binding transcriptional regulator [Alkalihalobacillus sp. AL-G]|uniref:LacI family DNA-binding transcriptional regulator n=1 Tax=Alkalihalobacillus sp. AL-G TaxID=2926399 RepID=UPI0027298D08|nr:LacI family DNA-binding transcriptional regulator [Alkalihalobacillus sp. AL-G]WLD94105.1 LacI family transcriptional regulator [Alkalihalobacillus sp. AL-G]
MATISDVAKKAGLSRATVSRVINEHPYVTEKKKQLVKQAMRELQYVPNSSAQKLRTQRTETIAVYVPRLTNPFFSHVVEKMEEVAAKQGFQLLLCQTRYNKQQELNYLRILRGKQIDGLILTSMENPWSEVEPYLAQGPIVLCNEYDYDATVPMVHLDQIKGGYIGTKHLIEKGHRSIVYCSSEPGKSRVSTDRQRGYIQAMNEAGIAIRPEWICTDQFTIEGGKRLFYQINQQTDRPTAVFTGSDEVAAGLIHEARKNGLRVPEDLAVIGFDDQPLAELIGLTTVKQPSQQLGETAMHLMFDMIRQKNRKSAKRIELEFELIIRRST